MSILQQLDETMHIFDNYYKIEEIQGVKREEKHLIPVEAVKHLQTL